MERNVLVQIEGLKKHFSVKRGVTKQEIGKIKAVDDVSFRIMENEILGLVGESGCGKSTLGRTVLKVEKPTSGKVIYNFNNDPVDLFSLEGKELRAFRTNLQLIFQNPYTSLNPRMSVFDIIAEPLRIARKGSEKDIANRVKYLIDRVGLEIKHMNRYPHAFSGGQRQRIGIARSLALNPKFIVADEAVSALDVSIQAQILNLLQDLRDEMNLTLLFIAHDLSVVEHISDRVCVMYLGRVVEIAETSRLFFHPKHPYSEALMSAIPLPIPGDSKRKIKLTGEIANGMNIPQGCPFHPRCLYAKEICACDVPSLVEVESGHHAACHRAVEIDLKGI